ncbi:MAG TPA: TIM barrel protein [Candidatus Tumulicola sp.]|nr:TIM barrel protein [Candidatus Tumulicola sp.]
MPQNAGQVMQVSCSSRPFAQAFRDGSMTQLEWIDLCAGDLPLDGIEPCVSHFPRTDVEYLAQIKKLCVDRALTVAGAQSEVAFGANVDSDVEQIKEALDVALAIGAPLVRFSCGAASGSPGIAWRELIRGLKHASGHAKLRNVTLALEPTGGMLVATPEDCKRALKECDSAWLRCALPLGALAASPGEWAPLLTETVLLVAYLNGTPPRAPAGARGFVTIDGANGTADASAVREFVAALQA